MSLSVYKATLVYSNIRTALPFFRCRVLTDENFNSKLTSTEIDTERIKDINYK